MTYGTYYFFAKVTGDSNHEDAVSSTGTVVAFREISSISITSNPTKMLYTPGATLDLTGLKITVTYTDNSTAEVTWTADSGITASHPKRYFPDRLPRRPDHHHHLWGKDGCDRQPTHL